MISLLYTLLELGHSTSQNLEFAHSSGVDVSFGEETITETNLLEIRRRHPNKVTLRTFSKLIESRSTGADWEWHIVGKIYTLKMRVQAKRIHKAGGIGNLNHMSKGAYKPQIDLLIEDADANNLFPIYCFYCAEPQRSHWTKGATEKRGQVFETGCLLADAETVKSKMPKKLKDIEYDTVPWHFLWANHRFSWRKDPYIQRFKEYIPVERYIEEFIEEVHYFGERPTTSIGLPTVFQLNDGSSNLDEKKGIFRTSEAFDAELIPSAFKERGINLLVRIDVRKPDLFAITA